LTIDQIFANHKKFFAKAKTPDYLKVNFIQDLKEVYLRTDQNLMLQAECFLNSKVRERVKNIEMEQTKPAVQWDFSAVS
jgi:hypothetical protein